MFASKYIFSAAAFLPLALVNGQNATTNVSLSWYPPNSTWINNLGTVINGTGTYGFIFNSSQDPADVPYGTYNWCNMPHVRRQEYPRVNSSFELEYVEVIHRHHKRTPYAANTFTHEIIPWYCSDEGLFFYGEPLNPMGNTSAATYWSVFTSSVNPFPPQGFNGTCQFPQITRGGLDDSWQHGKDLWGVYHDLLSFLPSDAGNKVTYRVTNNVITSQVAGMLVEGMYGPPPTQPFPLLIQPAGIDSLEPQYSCPSASSLYSTYGVGGTNPNWTAHLTAAAPLFSALDAVSGYPTSNTAWHQSFDHYYDNLSAKQCHNKPLPCVSNTSATCVTQAEANEVYRLGQYEYSYIYRDAPQSLQASTGSYGVWVAELAQHIRDRISGASPVIYRHNIAHDGSVSRLLSILQLDVMVWPGMGSEVVFEIYTKKGGLPGVPSGTKRYVRILWGGQVLRSSNPSLGRVDMIDADILLAYFDGLVGSMASKIVGLCSS